MTGRKTRQVKVYDAMKDKYKVIYEKRKGDGPMNQINIEEKNNFQSGTKKIAILSEAASTGISLQADKRVRNQRRYRWPWFLPLSVFSMPQISNITIFAF